MQSINLPSILTPDAGLLFWMLLAFLVVFFFVAKFGFPVIIKMVEERKNYIDEALGKAREANEKLADIQLESERMLNETRNQQAEILKQAKQSGENIIQQAREKAQNESAAMMQEAKKQIEAEKENALREIRQTVADLSVIIAEKVVRQHLADQTSQQQLIEKLLDESLKEN
ncbi:MAG: F0F1 ATP synthase subunit B [Alloprevotella sp.]|uniref:F0F1 ATP synthase subunit B n=1 Tax=Prevotellamassilia timonensis TaxID=1852370 RepID=UPI001DB8735B|nr:F0F1 ATP synthase subunit B [Prevotellamassilia timonensis]MBS7395435.1 F0F1 ATP synthase subunit B [Prevotellamassilia sp.]MCI5507431.1 F0F1 ATP synthase subunit B [Bacteroidales bacterium]MDY2974815.1 F0F1 ATP synthase subunit B [Alloprevotella sp.]MCF2634677.1 F0F1 ATP synthase subunit B [Prevotellamassilia timonensis]MCI6069538.1 F0F1 ATP synthase subunit B [Bacteroidales bacterium]